MIKRVLKGEECAACRICCVFDDSDIWEIPIFYEEQVEKIREILPGCEISQRGAGYVFHSQKAADGLYYCPALTEKGCILGDEKPFDCKIWPFRVNDFGGRRVITLSPVCPNVQKRPLCELTDLLNGGLAEKILSEADRHPDMVKPYIDGYPILFTE